MKQQCRLRLNNEVMEVLILDLCSQYKRIKPTSIEARLAAQFGPFLTRDFTYPWKLLNICQQCKYFMGEYPDYTKEKPE